MRRAFSLITAIFIILIISTLMMLMLSLSAQSAKQTTDIYLKEQAELLARSATEFAILAISGHERNSTSKCVEKIDIQYPKNDPTFDINVSLLYIGNNLPCTPTNILNNGIATDDSNGTVIIDTVVTTLQSDEPIRFHRRTIQKP